MGGYDADLLPARVILGNVPDQKQKYHLYWPIILYPWNSHVSQAVCGPFYPEMTTQASTIGIHVYQAAFLILLWSRTTNIVAPDTPKFLYLIDAL